MLIGQDCDLHADSRVVNAISPSAPVTEGAVFSVIADIQSWSCVTVGRFGRLEFANERQNFTAALITNVSFAPTHNPTNEDQHRRSQTSCLRRLKKYSSSRTIAFNAGQFRTFARIVFAHTMGL
jgi:hypothetical protein